MASQIDPSSLANGTDAKSSASSSMTIPTNATVPQAQSSNVNSKPELSNAEKKKLAKADKAARRAKDKENGAEAGSTAATPALPTSSNAKPSKAESQLQGGVKQGATPSKSHQSQGSKGGQIKRSGSIGKKEETLQLRRRPSQSKQQEAKEKEVRDHGKRIGFLEHLYGVPRRHTLEGASKDVHPAVLTLALQLSNYVVCGSHARGVGTLLALKSVVQSYTTPHGTSLARHLSNQHLSSQLSHLKAARPFSTTQANGIRWLKNLIAQIDPGVPEDEAKVTICNAIDTFIRERFTVADRVIADAAADRIVKGDVVLCFAKSAVVQQTLLTAASQGVDFRVVVVDSRPLFEGKNLARALSDAGINVTYCLTSALPHVISNVTKCLLGAHAVLVNGRIYSRTGTALVAMAAKNASVPVYICAESIKFTERASFDALVFNELAPEDELIPPEKDGQGAVALLKDWREKDALHLLNLMYDLTPAEFVDDVITELGSIPPSGAAMVQRISAGV